MTADTPGGGRWVATWTAAPQLTEPDNLPPPAFVVGGAAFADCTLRQTLRVSAGGSRTRLRFSNAYGREDLAVSAVRVAIPRGARAGASEIEPGTSAAVAFAGRPHTVVPPGALTVSDPLEFPLSPGSHVTVTAYLTGGQAVSGGITSHPGSRTTSYLRPGNHVDALRLDRSAAVDHWYFLSGVEVWSDSVAGVAVMLGDSLTDGRGSTTNGSDRWPDQLFDRLRAGQERPGRARPGRDIAIVSQGIGGNRVLRDGAGPGALARVDRDVLAVSGVRWLVVFEGVNDIGTASAAAASARRTAADLAAGYEQIITRAHAAGIAVYGATLTPFGGNEPYDDPDGHRQTARTLVNDWIRGGQRFDAVVDFDRAVRDPACPRRLRPAVDTGDGLHLNPAGYAALAAAVPPGLFQADPAQHPR